MPDDQLNDLIHRRLDGVASPDEQAALDDLLEREPEARRLFDEMREVHRLLAERSPVMPPTDLREGIAAEVRRHAAPGVVGADRFDAVRRRKAVLRIGFAIAAVFAVAFLLSPVLTKNLDTSEIGGTMAPRGTESSPMPVAEPGPAGRVVADVDGQTVIVSTVIDVDGPARLDVAWIRGEVELAAVSGATSYVESDDGVSVEFDGAAPELRLERLVPGPLSLTVEVTAGGVSTVFPEVIVPASTNF